MKVLMKGGMVQRGGRVAKADVLLENGVVAAVATDIAAEDAAVVDAAGCLVAPGFTDLHVHLRQPGGEAKETIATGTAAAAAGGFTTVCAMPNLTPVPDSLQNLAVQVDAIEKDAVVRVLPYASVTVGEMGECLSDIAVLAPFVCGFSDDGRGVQKEETMRRAMEEVKQAGSFIAAHCEDEAQLPENGVCVQDGCDFAQEHRFAGHNNRSEWAEVERDIRLAEETGCAVHICHASTAESFALVRAAKEKGLPVSCEVTPHNLLLCCEDIAEDDAKYKMNPPLRTAADREAALAALLDGTIDAIATDHAPHTASEKADGFVNSLNGVVGLETAFPVLYTGLVQSGILPLEKLLQLLNAGPRKVLGDKGNTIQPGAKADLVVLDLATERVVQPEDFLTKGRASPFAGWKVTGWPVMTFCDGAQVYRRE